MELLLLNPNLKPLISPHKGWFKKLFPKNRSRYGRLLYKNLWGLHLPPAISRLETTLIYKTFIYKINISHQAWRVVYYSVRKRLLKYLLSYLCIMLSCPLIICLNDFDSWNQKIQSNNCKKSAINPCHICNELSHDLKLDTGDR